MPMFLQSVIDDAVDELMPDIKESVLNCTDDLLSFALACSKGGQ